MKKNILFAMLLSIITVSVTNAQGTWVWMKGSDQPLASGVYGIPGIADPANVPQALYGCYKWVDQQGNFWLYGGLDNQGAGHSDLWKFNPTSYEFTYVKGNLGVGAQAPVYGTQGIPSNNNTPGARGFSGLTWVDNQNNLWLYAGDNVNGPRSDLWKYNIVTNMWTWMQGSQFANQTPNWGTMGIPSATNTPGSRREIGTGWVDLNGDFWFYGGEGVNVSDHYCDMWKYIVSLNEWVWMSGAQTVNATAVYGTQGQYNAANTPGGRSPYNMWTDMNGKLWLFGGGNLDLAEFGADMWCYDPNINQWKWVSGSNQLNAVGMTGNMCDTSTTYYPASRGEHRSCWKDECDNLWVFGGIHDINAFGSNATNDLWAYRPAQNDWTWVSGSLFYNQYGIYGTQGVPSPTNMPGAKMGASSFRDNAGNLWLFGGSDSWYINPINDLWKFIPDANCPLMQGCFGNQSAPVANFNSSKHEFCLGECINFMDLSTNSPTSWNWTFTGGNPSSSNQQNPINVCYTAVGTYPVTLTVSNGSGSNSFTQNSFITVYPLPPAPSITQAGFVLTCSPASAYQWFFNNNIITAATTQSYTVTQTGWYSVTIYNQNNCQATDSIYVVVDGINQIPYTPEILLAPNPSNGTVQVWLGNAVSESMNFIVYNQLGQKVFQSEIQNPNQKNNIDLGSLSNGIYQVEMSNNQFHYYSKLILIRK